MQQHISMEHQYHCMSLYTHLESYAHIPYWVYLHPCHTIGFPIRRAPEGLIKDVRPHLACAVCYITYWDLYSLCGKAASCILTSHAQLCSQLSHYGWTSYPLVVSPWSCMLCPLLFRYSSLCSSSLLVTTARLQAPSLCVRRSLTACYHGMYANGEGEVLVSTTSQVYHDGRGEVDPLNPQILEVLRSSDPGYPMGWDPEMDTFQVVGELQPYLTHV